MPGLVEVRVHRRRKRGGIRRRVVMRAVEDIVVLRIWGEVWKGGFGMEGGRRLRAAVCSGSRELFCGG